MKSLTYSLKIPEHLKFEDIINCKDKGGRFVFFQLVFPRPLFRPVIRMSKIYYLQPGEDAQKYNGKYNLLNMLIGWWGLPHGPSYTYDAITSNRTGIDITEDIYINLTEESFQKKEVTINQIESIFMHPDKDSVKELTKCFKKFTVQKGSFTSAPVFAYFINTENPYYVIGLHPDDFAKVQELETAIYKYFYKTYRFDFIVMDEDNEIAVKLKQQGLAIN